MVDNWMETNLQTVKTTHNAETAEYYAYANAVYVRVDRLRLLEKWWEEAEGEKVRNIFRKAVIEHSSKKIVELNAIIAELSETNWNNIANYQLQVKETRNAVLEELEEWLCHSQRVMADNCEWIMANEVRNKIRSLKGE